jgi:hypothetical protein
VGGVLKGGRRVNEEDGIWLMDFINLCEIEQINLFKFKNLNLNLKILI